MNKPISLLIISLIAVSAQAVDSCVKTLYIDGVFIDEAVADQGLSWPYDRITIGAEGNRWYLYNEYVGQMDEFAVYPGVLSPDRITAHYAAKDSNSAYVAAVSADNPLLWLRFEDAGTGHEDTAANSGSIGIDGEYITTGGDGITQVTGINADSQAIDIPDSGVDGVGHCVDVWDGDGDFSSDLDGDVTVELWFKCTSAGDYLRLFQHNGGWSVMGGYGVEITGPNLLGVMGADTTSYMTTQGDINDGTWHHLVVTYDSTYESPVIGSYPSEVMADSPVLYLRFEQLPLVDSSGNNFWVDSNELVEVHHRPDGAVGNAAWLGGGWVAAANQQTEPVLPTDYDHSYAFSPADITFEFWVCTPQPDEVGPFAYLFHQCEGETENSPGASRYNDGCRMLFGDNRVNPTGYAYAPPGTWPQDTEWHHHVCIWNEIPDTNGYPYQINIRWYRDGILYKNSTYGLSVAKGYLGPEMDHILIGNSGSRDNPGNVPYQQYIDEFAIYPYVLSEQRIEAHYAAWHYVFNNPPVAVAGPNQTAYAFIDRLADVTLDGSTSYDDDNDLLDYYWSWTIDANVYEANGVSPTIQLPVGEHQIELIVDDGIDESEPDYCTVTVIEPIRTNLWLWPRSINCNSRPKRVKTFMFLPKGIELNDVNEGPLIMYPCDVQSKYQRVFRIGHGRYARTVVMAVFDKDEICDYFGTGWHKVEVVGRLQTGRYFYGANIIRIVRPYPHKWPFRRFYNHH
jgi:hypothetical protein